MSRNAANAQPRLSERRLKRLQAVLEGHGDARRRGRRYAASSETGMAKACVAILTLMILGIVLSLCYEYFV